MTVLDSARPISDEKIASLVGGTGMSASPWNAETAAVDQAAHLERQRRYTGLSGGFWAAGFLWHISEAGTRGALGLFAGHGQVTMPLPEVGLFALAILFGVWLVATKAVFSARRFLPELNQLLVVAVVGEVGR